MSRRNSDAQLAKKPTATQAMEPEAENAGLDLDNAQRGSRVVAAAVRMERSIQALGPALAAIETPVSPQLARSLQATENAWREMSEEFGLLSSTELSRAVGSSSPNRSYASDQHHAGNLLAVKRPGGMKYPGFQIDPHGHTIRPLMRPLLAAAVQAGRSEAGLALWMVSPNGYLDGDRPVDRLDSDPDSILEAATDSFTIRW